MGAPLCSVVMSVRDERPEFLKSALNSILAQSVTDFEAVLIDDGSTSEDCISTLDFFARQDSRVKLTRRPPCGLAASLNYAISISNSKLIVRHDSDDWSSSRRIELLIAELNSRPEVILLGSDWGAYTARDVFLWDVEMPKGHDRITALFWNQNPFCHGSVAFRREQFELTGGYREEFHRSQDYDLFWRLAEIGKVDNLNQAIYHRRFTSNSVTKQDSLGQLISTRAARTLARARTQGIPENIPEAFELARKSVTPADQTECALRQLDSILLAGNTWRALSGYLLTSLKCRSVKALAKLMRGVLFALYPASASRIFNPKRRSRRSGRN